PCARRAPPASRCWPTAPSCRRRACAWCGVWTSCPSAVAARLEFDPDGAVLLAAGQGDEELAGAGAGDAFPGLDQEQRAVAGALDQAAAVVEKAVGLPFQRHAAVRTAVAIGIDAALAAHQQQG